MKKFLKNTNKNNLVDKYYLESILFESDYLLSCSRDQKVQKKKESLIIRCFIL